MGKVTIEFVEAAYHYVQAKTIRLWINGEEVKDYSTKMSYIKGLKWGI